MNLMTLELEMQVAAPGPEGRGREREREVCRRAPEPQRGRGGKSEPAGPQGAKRIRRDRAVQGGVKLDRVFALVTPYIIKLDMGANDRGLCCNGVIKEFFFI